ncbi:hypothetical protein [Bartonella grahamii]|uniref:hypothetical protein n=1 Tax=Bartonella grahamii TaxID=33045 RepID=UPI001ABACA75|nr:hypothetical protein [Bartonella grahamii]
MAFPLLFPLLASGGLLLRVSPHIFRYLAPKAVTGANRLGQLITKSPVGKFATKNPKFTASMVGGSVIESMMTPEKAHAPTGPKLPNMPQPQEPLPPNMVSGAEMPLGVGNHLPMPNALEKSLQELTPKVDVPQTQPLPPTSQTPPSEPTDLEKFLQSNTYKFFQSDAYKKLQDLFAGMSAAPSGGSGWDALASGVKHLNEGDKQRGQVNQTVEYLKSKGYSEEEARVMARNPQMLSALLTGGGGKDFNDGSSLIDDPTSPTGKRVVYHPGSKAYMDNERAAAAHENRQVHAKVLMDDIDYLLEYADKFKSYATGHIANIASRLLPTSEQSDARQVMQSIQSRIALDRIDQMKQLSQRGTIGLGNVSDKDIEMLKQSLGDLSFNMSARQFRRRLNIIKDVISRLNPEVQAIVLGRVESTEENMRNAVSGNNSQYSSKQSVSQGGGANLPTINSIEEANKFPAGTNLAINHNGTRYEIRRK